MRILMIAPFPYGKASPKGGVEAVTVNLIKEFKDNENIEMIIISIKKEIDKKEVWEYSKNINIYFLPYGIIKSTKVEMLFHGRIKIKQIIKEFAPDIIHIQGNGTILLTTLGIRKENIIVTQHGILKEEFKYQNSLFQKLSLLINIITEKICVKNIINWIFISEYNMHLAQNNLKYISQSKLIYIPINSSFFQTMNSKKTNIRRIIYVGSISKRKGLSDLLRAIQILDNQSIYFHLDVVGGFIEKSYKKEVEKIISNFSPQQQIEFHGWLTQNEINRLMQKVSILVLPSYQETTPGVIAEAMAAGKIVIATTVGGIPEMVDDKKSGFLFEKGNVVELVEILRHLNINYRYIKNISKNAREKAITMFSSKSVANKTYQFYTKVASE